MKKIAILTFHFSNHNYGAVLQTYASVVVLRKLGFAPYVINFGKSIERANNNFLYKFTDIIFNPFASFRRRFLPLTRLYVDKNELIKLNEEFECFYVGSDQVWRHEFAEDKLFSYFLNFAAEDKLKVSYAASFGKEKIDYDFATKIEINKLLNRFDAISVREASGVDICKEEFKVDAVKVLDPTLLLIEADYATITRNARSAKSGKYIAYYELGYSTSTSTFAAQLAAGFKLPIENIYRQNINLIVKKITPFSSVDRWLNSIKYSELVITNSYHCVIFSIIYKRNFIVVSSEYGGNTRINSLLDDLGLTERFFDSYDEKKLSELRPIDYAMVENRLELLRKKSFEFLEVFK